MKTMKFNIGSMGSARRARAKYGSWLEASRQLPKAKDVSASAAAKAGARSRSASSARDDDKSEQAAKAR